MLWGGLDMVMNYITRCDTEETEIEFTVQGRKVVGIFPTGDNSGIYQYLKRILVNTYIDKNHAETHIF
ncbi:hypothetical protein I3000191B1_15550 [Flavonifractor plautii]